jgi:hypothetical protein
MRRFLASAWFFLANPYFWTAMDKTYAHTHK